MADSNLDSTGMPPEVLRGAFDARFSSWKALCRGVDDSLDVYTIKVDSSGNQYVVLDSTAVVLVTFPPSGGGGGDATAANQELMIAELELKADLTEDQPVTLDGEVVITGNDNMVSTNNATTTPLSGGGSWTGVADDLLGYTGVSITLATDADSASDGMVFQFSTDGTNWDDQYAFTYDGGDAARRFQFPVTARYFRVDYTSKSGGPGNQSYFRVQTILHRQNLLTSIHRIEGAVSTDRSATLVKSVIIAQTNGVGDFTPIQASSGGILKVSADISGNAGSDIGDVDVASLPDSNLTIVKMGTASTSAIMTSSYVIKLDLSAVGDVVTTMRSLLWYYTGDEEIVLSFDAGTTDHVTVAPYSSGSFDFYALGLSESGDIYAKHTGTAATTGKLVLNVAGV